MERWSLVRQSYCTVRYLFWLLVVRFHPAPRYLAKGQVFCVEQSIFFGGRAGNTPPPFNPYLMPHTNLPTGHTLQFDLEQLVYLKTDKEQNARMVTAIQLRPNRNVLYYLALGTSESCHYGVEITEEKDILLSVS